MKIVLIATLATFSVQSILASAPLRVRDPGDIRAEPYQTIFLYLVYQYSNLAKGGGRSGAMASGCIGSMLDDTCGLFEFLSYIQAEGYSPDAGSMPSSSNTIAKATFPDPVAAASVINQITVHGSQYSPTYNADKIFDSQSVDNAASSVLDAAATVLGDTFTTFAWPGSKDPTLLKIQTAMDGIQQAYTNDWVPTLIKAFETWSSNVGYVAFIDSSYKQAVDGTPINYLDLGNMTSQNPNFVDKWTDFIEAIYENNQVSKRAFTLSKRDNQLLLNGLYRGTKLQIVASKVYGAGRRQNGC